MGALNLNDPDIRAQWYIFDMAQQSDYHTFTPEGLWATGTEPLGRILQFLTFSRDAAVKEGVTDELSLARRAFGDYEELLILPRLRREGLAKTMPKLPHFRSTNGIIPDNPFLEDTAAYKREEGKFSWSHKDLKKDNPHEGLCPTQFDMYAPDDGEKVIDTTYKLIEKRIGVPILRPRHGKFNSLQLIFSLGVVIAQDVGFYKDLPNYKTRQDDASSSLI